MLFGVLSTDIMQTISFDEIVKGRDSTVRVTDDQLLYAVDLVMVMTGQARDHAGKTIRNISDAVFHSENFSERQLSTRGGAPTKLLTFQHAIELVMVLPGKVANETRTQFSNIIKRYMAGDGTLIKEIKNNAESNSPISQMARESLVEAPEDRKRRRELEDVELASKKVMVKEREVGLVHSFIDTMRLINPKWSDDTRLRMQTEDWLKNVAFKPALGITDGSSVPVELKSISVSQVAQEMGKRLTHGQSIRVGSHVVKAYRKKYGKLPPKHAQWVDGAERSVNSYTEADRDLVEHAITCVCDAQSESE
jgi:hypothetical protein